MRILFWVGLGLVALGVVLLVLPIPYTESAGMSAGGMSVEMQTQHSERLSPIVSGIMILAGAVMSIMSRSRQAGTTRGI